MVPSREGSMTRSVDRSSGQLIKQTSAEQKPMVCCEDSIPEENDDDVVEKCTCVYEPCTNPEDCGMSDCHCTDRGRSKCILKLKQANNHF